MTARRRRNDDLEQISTQLDGEGAMPPARWVRHTRRPRTVRRWENRGPTSSSSARARNFSKE